MNILYFVILFFSQVILSSDPEKMPGPHEGHPGKDNSLRIFLESYDQKNLNNNEEMPFDFNWIFSNFDDSNKTRLDEPITEGQWVVYDKSQLKKKKWTKINEEILKEMLEYERKHPHVKQKELEDIFKVNRTTYWRWKNQY